LTSLERELECIRGFSYASEALNVTHSRVCFPSHADFDGGYGPENCRYVTWRRFIRNGERFGTCTRVVEEERTRSGACTVEEERTGSGAGTLEERSVTAQTLENKSGAGRTAIDRLDGQPNQGSLER
jgi:hypothetical protein